MVVKRYNEYVIREKINLFAITIYISYKKQIKIANIYFDNNIQQSINNLRLYPCL